MLSTRTASLTLDSLGARAARCEHIPSHWIFRTLSVSQCCQHVGAGLLAVSRSLPGHRIFRTLSVSQCCRHIGAGLLAVSSLPVGLSRISRRPKWQIKRHRGNARAPASAPARGVGSAALSGPSVPPLVLPELGLPLLGPRGFCVAPIAREFSEVWLAQRATVGAC